MTRTNYLPTKTTPLRILLKKFNFKEKCEEAKKNRALTKPQENDLFLTHSKDEIKEHPEIIGDHLHYIVFIVFWKNNELTDSFTLFLKRNLLKKETDGETFCKHLIV